MARHPILARSMAAARPGPGPARGARGGPLGPSGPMGGGGGPIPVRAAVALGGWTFSAALIVMGSILAAPVAIAVGAALTLMFTHSLLRWAPRTGAGYVPLRVPSGPVGVHGPDPSGGRAHAGRPRGRAYCGPEWVAPARPVTPLGARRRRILAGLEAMARRSTFPGEAAAFRAKAEQLRRSLR